MEIHPYIIDTLLPDLVGHDRHPSAFLVYLVLWQASQMGRVCESLSQLAEKSGLSKRAVQLAIKRLVKRQLISVKRGDATEIPEYFVHQPWQRPLIG